MISATRQSAMKMSSTEPQAAQEPVGRERRQFRRHDLEQQSIPVERADGSRKGGGLFGKLMDISAGGVRIRTEADRTGQLRPEHQIRVRLELPAYAGICPFVDTHAERPQPTRQWVGWMTVARVQPVDGDSRKVDVAGQLMDMEELDRGMLGLYLSTQPLAA